MQCSICHSPANLVFSKINGYISGETYDIFECSNCKSQFINPMSNLQASYDKIYGGEEANSVYSFYYYLAKGVQSVRKPFRILTNFNAIFWAVGNALDKIQLPQGSKILEVGSGLGYLVDALNQEGFEATGLEYSPEATHYANENFGQNFTAGDVFSFAPENKNKFDCIIATEVIEHVPDPTAFVQTTLSMLKPGGKFILTTPNKDWEPHGTVWKTDYAPIHLWWYTEQAMQEIARNLQGKVEFVSFEKYKQDYLWHWTFADKDYQANRPSILTSEGEKIDSGISKRQKLQNLIPTWMYLRMVVWYHKLTFLQKQKSENDKMYIMCAIFSK